MGRWRLSFPIMRIGRILGVLVFLLVLAGAAMGVWYWKTHRSAPAPAVATDAEHDTVLVARVKSLQDSLAAMDSSLREAQYGDADSVAELAKRHADLWTRYTWARSRLSEVRDARAAPPVPAGDAAGLGSALGHLAIYLWVLVGVVAVGLALLLWWIFGRRRPEESPLPLTEPTMTRVDRNVRMPVGQRSNPAPREATFTQQRAARAAEDAAQGRSGRIAEPDPDLPAAPPPKTGRHAWENTTSQPNPSLGAPAEPTVVQDYVVSMAKRGRTSSEIARRLRIPQDQVDLILKLRRNG